MLRLPNRVSPLATGLLLDRTIVLSILILLGFPNRFSSFYLFLFFFSFHLWTPLPSFSLLPLLSLSTVPFPAPLPAV